jgi:hypothetical protein
VNVIRSRGDARLHAPAGIEGGERPSARRHHGPAHAGTTAQRTPAKASTMPAPYASRLAIGRPPRWQYPVVQGLG